MPENNKILCKVASVINGTTVVINKGELDGVKIGQKFKIYRLGREITDPDTNESLESLQALIGNGKVTYVQEKISTIESDMYDHKPDKKEIYENPMKRWGFGIDKTVIINGEKVQKEFNDPRRGDIAEQIG